MIQPSDPTPIHCYTNPSFCQQSEYISEDSSCDLPPPPLFQTNDDLPPPPPPPPSQLQLQHQTNVHNQVQYGQSNPCFQGPTEVRVDGRFDNRYCYLEDARPPPNHRRYGSLPVEEHRRTTYGQSLRYEYLQEQEELLLPVQRNQLQRRASTRYELIPQQQVQLRSAPLVNQDDQDDEDDREDDAAGRTPTATTTITTAAATTAATLQMQKRRGGRKYDVVPGDPNYSRDEEAAWNAKHASPVRRHVNTPNGRYSRVPSHDEDPPPLPERNGQELSISPRNNLATQKLHEILATPRKPRSKSEERTLSPRRHHSMNHAGTPQRRAITPGGSPTGRTFSPSRSTPHGTPQNQTFSTNGPQTSTPNKEPTARRCLTLLENSSRHQQQQQQDICPASNCGRLRYVGTAPVDLATLGHGDPPPRYGYLENGPESMPMVLSGSPRYQMMPANHKRNGYQSVESAFIARTAVVPPLSPPNSDANTTLASGLEKNERRNAPLLLVLVGVLTCGLAIYLSWTQGRWYYFDCAAGCGACCALAGACRSLRRTWTGLGLAGLSALSCAGLLLMAAKAPKAGTPLHDVTAGALCGVSVLGASLALLALLTPKCSLGRHRRVHSWIPRLSP